MGLIKDRVTIRVSGNMEELLREIMDLTPSSTPTEVVKRALAVYHTLVIAQDRGEEILRISKDASGAEQRKRVHL